MCVIHIDFFMGSSAIAALPWWKIIGMNGFFFFCYFGNGTNRGSNSAAASCCRLVVSLSR